MDFDLTDEQHALRSRIKAFSEEHCGAGVSTELDGNPRYPEQLHAAMAEAGIFGHCLPKELGGAGGSITDAVIINEILSGRSDAAGNMLFVNLIGATLVAVAGNAEQKQRIIPGVAAGRIRLAFAMTEPEAGSDAGSIQCRAEPAGEGHALHGVKLYTTGALQADYILTVTLTDPEQTARRGSSIFLVPREAPGLRIEALGKMAGNAVPSCRVEYDGVTVGADALLGKKNAAWTPLMVGAGLERLLVAASCLGRAEIVLQEVIDFVRNRRQFGQPVARFQAVQHQVADMATDIEAMRWLVYSAAWRIDRGQLPVKEISMAKVFCAERLNEIVNRGMRLLGGRAYLKECSMERHLRESFLGLYAGGTVEIQRNLIARQLGLE
jgi:alkylation response protein AidB-like acyl-CoA dehydrogenase